MANIFLKKPYTPVMFTSASKTFNVYGVLLNTEAVYVSGTPFPQTTTFNPFASSVRLSAIYPPFNAVKLLTSAYTTNNVNSITVTVPSAVNAGYADIIVQNEAGYGSFLKYVIKETYTPSPTGTYEYNNYTPFVRGWQPGIKVLSGVEV